MRRCVILGLDGLRGDVAMTMMMQGKLPGLKSVSQYSAVCDQYETCAKTHSGPRAGPGFQWKTSAGWTSVFTGVDNKLHMVKDNTPSEVKAYWVRSAIIPTVFQITQLSTAVFAKPFILGTVDIPGVLDQHILQHKVIKKWDDADGDSQLAEEFISTLNHPHCLNFVHLDTTDQVGHKHGFGFNKEYEHSIKVVDCLVYRMVNAVRMAQITSGDKWLIIVVSDHGGFGKEHGTSTGFDDQIPFLMNRIPITGPPIATQMDVAPTVLRWLNEAVPSHMTYTGFTFPKH
jgi:hypothetical protein